MKKFVLAAAICAAASTATAGNISDPVITPVEIVDTTTTSSSGIVLPLLLLVVVAAAVSG